MFTHSITECNTPCLFTFLKLTYFGPLFTPFVLCDMS